MGHPAKRRAHGPWFSAALGVLLFLGLSMGQALAYVIPPEQVLEFSVKAMGRLKSLTVTETLIEYGPPAAPETPGLKAPPMAIPAGPAPESEPETAEAQPVELTRVSTTLKYQFPAKFREEVELGGSERVFAVSGGSAAKVLGNRLVGESEDPLDFYKDILLFRDPQLLYERLLLDGINPDNWSLGRFQGRVAYVIGARYPDESRPQLWIDKKTFLPMRWIVTRQVAGAQAPGLEIRYEDWQGLTYRKNKATTLYPRRILFYENGLLTRERLVEGFSVNPDFPRRDFDVPLIKATTLPSDTLQEERNFAPDIQEVHNLLDNFRKMYE